jgi:NAD+ diphosphatase
MQPRDFFLHCPRCGCSQPPAPSRNPFHCDACGFHYFFNPTVAVAVFIRREDGRALFIRRARAPAQGRLAPPGGFIDIGETAEDAAAREIREEVGLELLDLAFLCSQPNKYFYKEVEYPVLDLFFTARVADATEGACAADEVASCEWLDPMRVPVSDMAFPSMQRALAFWQARLTAR